MISTVSVTTLGEPERYKTVLTWHSRRRAHIVPLYREMQALLPKSGRQNNGFKARYHQVKFIVTGKKVQKQE